MSSPVPPTPAPRLGLADRAALLAAIAVLAGAAIAVLTLVLAASWTSSAAAPAVAFLLLIAAACLGIARLARSVVAPMQALRSHAEQLVQAGRAGALTLQTGDEFETVADAFNRMSARLDASMRRIQEIAFRDSATGIANYERFLREVEAHRTSGASAGAVAVFELQRLTSILRTMGADDSRALLRAIAAKLSDAVCAPGKGAATGSLLARLSVDEFAVLAPGLSTQAEAARFLHEALSLIDQPFDWRGHKLSLGVQAGASLCGTDRTDADTLVRRARLALVAAEASASRAKIFSPALDREATARFNLEREMRTALERNEFRAYFQPKLSLASGRVEGCEALARWVRPDNTIISPGRFIPIAEETGLIGQLSDAIMREACWKAAAWSRAGALVQVAVNVSALQFQRDRFAEAVLRTIDHAGLPGRLLELEITETVAMADPERTARILAPLRDAGVRLAIDDFGCGHSNLAALSQLPFDVIKIDQQFVRALERGEKNAGAIIDMVLALARTLDLEVVAEGVERRAEAEFMAARGCHWAQGFLYGAAVSASEFAELLRRQRDEDPSISNAA